MFPIPKATWLPLLAAICVPLTSASRPDPADPKAPVPAATYRSPLAPYQPSVEAPVAPWRDTNAKVREGGGWRAYAREASGPEAAPTAPQAASQPMNGGRAGHAGHAAPNPK
ncbi:MAG: hypothetical protein H7337_12165 [Rhizobacter sp.]|nr:hypothetical protein [Rhizobacter sp.]